MDWIGFLWIANGWMENGWMEGFGLEYGLIGDRIQRKLKAAAAASSRFRLDGTLELLA